MKVHAMKAHVMKVHAMKAHAMKVLQLFLFLLLSSCYQYEGPCCRRVTSSIVPEH